jgi:4-hydroxy-tetrahydrodipicolinate synthase
MRLQSLITPLKDAVYGGGEPTGEAHGRMKAAMAMAGILRDGTVRPPTHAPNAQQLETIRVALEHAGLSKRAAA